MSFTVRRKQLLFLGLALSLAGAMFVNWYYTRPVQTSPAEAESTTEAEQINLGDAQFVNASVNDSYFARAELNRSKARDEAREGLNAVIGNEDADEQSRESARQALEKLEADVITQTEIENFIRAKSGGDVLVSLGSTAEVILQKNTLTDELCIQIKDIITRKTNISSEKITIIEAK